MQRLVGRAAAAGMPMLDPQTGSVPDATLQHPLFAKERARIHNRHQPGRGDGSATGESCFGTQSCVCTFSGNGSSESSFPARAFQCLWTPWQTARSTHLPTARTCLAHQLISRRLRLASAKRVRLPRALASKAALRPPRPPRTSVWRPAQACFAERGCPTQSGSSLARAPQQAWCAGPGALLPRASSSVRRSGTARSSAAPRGRLYSWCAAALPRCRAAALATALPRRARAIRMTPAQPATPA